MTWKEFWNNLPKKGRYGVYVLGAVLVLIAIQLIVTAFGG